jgi:uncharacterized Zn finger protein
MKTASKITNQTIRSRVGERNYGLGEKYFEDGSVFNCRREGRSLKARCQGSRDQAYQVEVTLDDKGVASAECSCPVGGAGHCKHVAAVLLAWKNQPETFAEVENVDAGLARRTKEELIALVKLMLRQQPDLETLLEMPLPAAGPRSAEVTPDAYRRQAEAAFDHGGYDWGAASAIADELQTLIEVGDEFLKQEDHAAATAVYQGVCAAVLDRFNSVHDEPGDLHRMVSACVEGLEKCLRTEEDNPARRETILRALFDVYALDVEQGGIGLSDSVPDFTECTTPAERRTIAGWIRETMSGTGEWGRECFAGLLLELEADTLDDETYLRICRENGRRHDLVDRLCQLGRVPEAIRETESAGDYDLMSLADVLESHGQGAEAERLVRERSRKSRDSRLLEWLKKRAAGRKDTAAVLELAEQLFADQPSLTGYQEIRKLATKFGRWEELRPKLLDGLKKKKYTHVLVQIYLKEGDIDQALELMKSEREYGFGYGYGFGMKFEVAKAAEKTRPEAALEIYRKYAEQLIEQRGRTHYVEACRYLKKVLDLYQRLGQGTTWTRYLAQLREKHTGLRAFQEELARAKLVGKGGKRVSP